MWISATVSVNLESLRKLKIRVLSQLENGGTDLDDVFKLWAYRYRSFAQLRFDRFSKGGGDWKRLSPVTIAMRRRGRGQPSKKKKPETKQSNTLKYREMLKGQVKEKTAVAVTILRDTGTLFNALAPTFVGSPGAIEQRIRFGIRVGYGGPQRHIGFRGKAGTETIADIAAKHQNGFPPKLPKREIIVEPPETLLKQMAQDLQTALDTMAKE